MWSYFDTHCDTLTKIYKNNKYTLSDEALAVNYKTLNCNFPSVQCFSFFNEGAFLLEDFYKASKMLKSICQNDGKMLFATKASDILKAVQENKICAILTGEGLGNTSDFKAEDVELLKEWGYSILGLVWNYDNKLGGSCHGRGEGLTAEGKKTLHIMEKKNIIADVSHLSKKSFYDTFDNFCKPIIASHSNSAVVCKHKRNLDKEQILTIIKQKGTIGLTFYAPFVGRKKDGVSAFFEHVDSILELGGDENISIGSDFDGMDEPIDNIESAKDVSNLFDTMLSNNYSKKQINDISFNNIYKIFCKYELFK